MKLKFDPYKFNTLESNDIPVYWKNIPWSNGFVYIRIVLGIGARHDSVGKEGTAHFFEHLPFNGCNGWPNFDAVEVANRSIFMNTLNASTWFEKTVFTAKVSTDKLNEAFSFFYNFVFNPILDPIEIERERKVITQEIWKRYESEKKEQLIKQTTKLAYGDHTFSRMDCALGWHNTVANISKEDISAFHKKNYHSGNLSLVLVGDIDEKSILKSITEITAKCPRGKKIDLPVKLANCPNPETPEFSVSAKEYLGLSGTSARKSTKIGILRILPIIDNEQLLYLSNDLLREILFKRIRGELGATYSPQIGSDVFIDHLSISILLEIAPETLKAVQKIILSTINEISIADKKHIKIFSELKINHLEKKLYFDITAGDIIGNAIGELTVKGKIIPLEEDYKNLEDVSYNDVAEFFSKELKPEQLFWSILTP